MRIITVIKRKAINGDFARNNDFKLILFVTYLSLFKERFAFYQRFWSKVILSGHNHVGTFNTPRWKMLNEIFVQ